MEDQLICGLSETEIQELKEKHGALILGTVKQGENEYHAIFKEPNFKTLEATGAVTERSVIRGTKALYDNCIVKADEEIEQRDLLQLKAVQAVAEYMQSFNVSVKNL